MKKIYTKPDMSVDAIEATKIMSVTLLDTEGPKTDPTPAPWRY